MNQNRIQMEESKAKAQVDTIVEARNNQGYTEVLKSGKERKK